MSVSREDFITAALSILATKGQMRDVELLRAMNKRVGQEPEPAKRGLVKLLAKIELFAILREMTIREPIDVGTFYARMKQLEEIGYVSSERKPFPSPRHHMRHEGQLLMFHRAALFYEITDAGRKKRSSIGSGNARPDWGRVLDAPALR